MKEPTYCDLCGCVCIACVQLGGCDDCELLHPDLIEDEVLIYGYPIDIWNKLSEDEQIRIQDSYEYDLQHPDQKDWFID